MSGPHQPNARATSPGFDPSLCEREPIHIPGAIQPHGAVLAVLADAGLVTHASANLLAILGRPAEAVLGRPLAEAVGEAACRVLLSPDPRDGAAVETAVRLPGRDGGILQLRAHRSGPRICVDIEPVPRREAGQEPPIVMAQSILETFRQTASIGELCESAVRGLKAITGFDRVMAYRFAADGHGEVIAEARAAELDPYLGLRYPATDIPPQARRLYLRRSVGAIADAGYQPVPLLADPALDDGTPLDLTHSALRSVSPLHREFMRNMKTAASLTVGLAHGQDLWGMLVCHHATPRIAGPELRAIADMIGRVASLLLAPLGEAQVYAERLERNATLRTLVGRLAGTVPMREAFAAAATELLDLVNAAGVTVRLSGDLLHHGRIPPPAAAERALAVLHAEAGGAVLAVDDLGLRFRQLADCTAAGSGALLLPLARDTDDAILWFRPELRRTVIWGGNPDEAATSDPVTARLSARASFAAWQQTVSGHSAPWTELDLAMARELHRAVAAETAQRTKAELARLRHYDALTGLPNRSLLLDRLAEAARDTGPAAALLFLDLDRFKAVNDTMGHAAGDALLVEVARRLLAAGGPDNLTARLGGDEFVVLCRGLDRTAVAGLAERVRQAIEAPYEIAGRACHVSASIGIAFADQLEELDLVQAADMAMYVAKQRGGNREMTFERSLYERAARQFELDHDLRDALGGNDQFVLVYQPQFWIDAGSLRLVGFEALLRWRHPRHGWMSPKLFIPQAEQSGLILPLGEWVLAHALREGRALQRASPDTPLQLAVNVSAAQLARPGFCSGLAEALHAEGFPPTALCLEVTEGTLTDVAAAYVLAEVRKLGVHVAIDDFGTGYSSLFHLRRLPADVVKLDGGFVQDVAGDARGVNFIGAVIALARAAEKAVVVEGIETQAQFDIAAAAGADIVQGVLFAQPLYAKAAAELAARS
jgi:diguanylate cyclase (GGDEF)-like protein